MKGSGKSHSAYVNLYPINNLKLLNGVIVQYSDS